MKRIYLSSPHMEQEERQELISAFDHNWIAPAGPQIEQFEQDFAKYIGLPYAAALSSCTAGIHLSLVVLGIQPGDEVFASDLTFAATINPILYLGAKPVLIDSDLATWNMDPNLLSDELKKRAKINKLPKAVIVVSLYGQSADLDSILSICQQYNIPVIEDAAESLGATYRNKKAGTSGILNVFSFNGNKIITTGGGGMVASTNKKLIDQIRFLSTQAKDPAPYYQHSQIGYNYRLSNLSAAIGIGQLKNLDSHINRRISNYNQYFTTLSNLDISFMPEASYGKCTRWLTCILTDKATEIRLALEEKNIESRPVWKPMHLQPIFSQYTYIGGKVSEYLFEKGLCLPSGSNLIESDIERVISVIKQVF